VAAPALRVGLDDGLAAVVPGQTVTYTLPLANAATGPADGATAVGVTATLPPGSFVKSAGWTLPAGATGAAYTFAGNTFTFGISGTVAPTAHGSLTVVGQLPAAASGSLTTTATLASADVAGVAQPPASARDVDAVAPPPPPLSWVGVHGQGRDGRMGAVV